MRHLKYIPLFLVLVACEPSTLVQGLLARQDQAIQALTAQQAMNTQLTDLSIDVRELDRLWADILDMAEIETITAQEIIMIDRDLQIANGTIDVMNDPDKTPLEKQAAKVEFDRRMVEIRFWHGQWKARTGPVGG